MKMSLTLFASNGLSDSCTTGPGCVVLILYRGRIYELKKVTRVIVTLRMSRVEKYLIF